MRLPIDEIKETFLSELATLDEGGLLILTAPTGSGKSTRLPKWCHSHFGRPVLVIEPRRVAARTLANWLSAEREEKPGQSVGFSVRFERRLGPQTQIVFVTPGVARRYLVEGRMNDFAVVIFDEFHERSWETDSLLALLAASEGGPRLLVTSATLVAKRLEERYRAKTLSSEGRSYPVEIRYCPDPDFPQGPPTSRGLADRAAKLVRQTWESGSEGSILTFLPGLSSMRELESRLKGLPVVLLHGSFGQKEQARAFDQGKRQIILATNVAESSLTLPGIRCVIDTGLERRQVHQSGYVALATVPISLASADQRAGRAGRLGPGLALRLWSQAAKLELEKPPELCRMELEDLLLFLSALPQGTESPSRWLDPPPEFAWDRALKKLQASGLVGGDGCVTDLGKKAQELPLEPDWARVLLLAPSHLQGDLCDLCALGTARRSPLRSTRCQDTLENRKGDWGEEPWGRTLSLLRVGDSRKHGLDPEGLQHCRRVSTELRQILGQDKRPSAQGRLHPELQDFLCRAWPERFFLLRQGRQAWGNGEVECRVARGEEVPEDWVAAFFLQIEPVMGKGLRVDLRARQALPVRVSTLRRAGIGEVELSKVRWLEGKLQARMVYRHAGRELGSREDVLEGEPLRKGLALLAKRGQWKPELCEKILEEQFYWRLSQAFLDKELPERTVEELVFSRLEELGVQEQEDLELLDDDDFLSHPVPAHELESLLKNYPRIYSIGGVSFRMDYQPRRKKVVMHSLSQQKGVSVKVQHLPRWNSWKVELDERGRRTLLR